VYQTTQIEPFEDYVGEETVVSYVGIRADEDREGYISTKPTFGRFSRFKDAGITEQDVYRILADAGLGLPKYYEWRSRSGCYFCFFQRHRSGLVSKKKHPELFEKAKQYEKIDPTTGERYTGINARVYKNWKPLHVSQR